MEQLATTTWRIAPGRVLSLDASNGPCVMGILNVTPDSFADGGQFFDAGRAIEAGLLMASEGASIIDIGGESTRPGASPVPAHEQIRRVIPVIAELAKRLPWACVLSIDTTIAEVAARSLDAGAAIINDTSAGRDDVGMLPLAALRGCGLILMHRHGPPALDRFSDQYTPAKPAPLAGDVVAVVRSFLRGRMETAVAAGVDREAIVIDPGLGFGKSVDQNLGLIGATASLLALGGPLLSALSRKSFVGRIGLGRDSAPEERLVPSLALSVVHARLGARIFRVHDVGPHVQALRAALAL